MPPDFLTTLLTENESEYLDFKRHYHTNKANLLHDILCMANSLCSKNRYIIFGVEDNKTVIGLEDTEVPNQLFTQNGISDFLRSVHLNKPLYNHVYFNTAELQGKKIGILTIQDIPWKPFFCSKIMIFKALM